MDTQIFTLLKWEYDYSEDGWTFTDEYIVLKPDLTFERHLSGMGSQDFKEQLNIIYPNAIWYKNDIHMQYGKIKEESLKGLKEETKALLRAQLNKPSYIYI